MALFPLFSWPTQPESPVPAIPWHNSGQQTHDPWSSPRERLRRQHTPLCPVPCSFAQIISLSCFLELPANMLCPWCHWKLCIGWVFRTLHVCTRSFSWGSVPDRPSDGWGSACYTPRTRDLSVDVVRTYHRPSVKYPVWACSFLPPHLLPWIVSRSWMYTPHSVPLPGKVSALPFTLSVEPLLSHRIFTWP